ncbi:DNA polymerase [Tardibacter chloracetimidivorans]|uniref:DNA polymerase n=1 Tax=Tardibacter chloracetimidivorans TaxID=1921510 RepID=UPI001D05BDE8|nr:DNA polymerase [Tardibacter chloracetimidivorans]
MSEGWHPIFNEAVREAEKIVIHNSFFDRTMLAAHGVDIPLEKTHDTMAQALAHGLPGGLGALCEILGVPSDDAKDKEGRQLINLFCKPRPKASELRRATKETHPDEWAKFVSYAGSDITAMREVFKRLPAWNYQGAELALWQLDQTINRRGFAVDVPFAAAAVTAVEREQKRLAARVNEMTEGEVEAATQRDKLLSHLLEMYGVRLPDMTKGTLERRLGDPELPDPVRELIAIRLEASTTSTAKYNALLGAASSDGRLRGGLQFCGAARTGRWSGRLFQPQNLPRPKHSSEEIEASIDAITGGCADLLFSDVIARASSAIRGAIIAPEGKKLVAADLSNIEGRMLAWLAGEEWKLQAFRDFDAGTGPDLYKLAYSRSFNITPGDVTKDQRQLGKVQELALGYQGAVGAFASMAALYGMELPDEQVLALVKAWRRANPKIVKFWYGLEETAVQAVLTPGTTLYFGQLKLRRDGAWLRIELPSGRALCYPSPKLVAGTRPCSECGGLGVDKSTEGLERCPACHGKGRVYSGRDVLSYMGTNQYTRKWERIMTYGGKLAENVTQAASRDVIAHAMPIAEAAGFEVVLTVHDEIVTETPDDPKWSKEGLAEIMATNPAWARGLPLAAEGLEAKRYGK